MPDLTAAQVADIVARGRFNELIDAIEDEHVEAKTEPYPDSLYGRLEHAKDVAGFANAGAGYGQKAT
jgi:hypothetical protein